MKKEIFTITLDLDSGASRSKILDYVKSISEPFEYKAVTGKGDGGVRIILFGSCPDDDRKPPFQRFLEHQRGYLGVMLTGYSVGRAIYRSVK